MADDRLPSVSDCLRVHTEEDGPPRSLTLEEVDGRGRALRDAMSRDAANSRRSRDTPSVLPSDHKLVDWGTVVVDAPMADISATRDIMKAFLLPDDAARDMRDLAQAQARYFQEHG